MKQFFVFIKKEALHIRRDPRTLLILIWMPVIQIILYGFALTNEVKNAGIAVCDASKDEATRALISRINASRYFDVIQYLHSGRETEAAFRQGKIRMAVVFPPRFRYHLLHAHLAQVQLIADASDPNTANLLTNYATAVINSYLQDVNGQQALPYTIKTQVRMLYNPELKGAYNFVPGVMALVLMLVCAMMTSMAIVREKENGNMEVLLVSPLQPFWVVLAKTVPYLLLSAVNIGSILLLCVFVLNVPIRGSLGLLVAESLLFTITSLSVGILVSNHARTQQTAMISSMMILFLPTLLFSGFLFPVENMPYPLQLLSNLVPAKWFFIIVKEVMIKGMDFYSVWKQTLILMAMTAFLLGISIYNFKIRLE